MFNKHPARYFTLTFRIEHWWYLHFWCEIFRIGYPIKALHRICTTKSLLYPMSDQSGRNIAAWQSISFVGLISPIWFPSLKWVSGIFFQVLYFTNSHIPNLARPLVNFPLLISLFSSIIQKMIFYLASVVSFTSLIMIRNSVLGQNLSLISLWYLISWAWIIPRTPVEVESFTQVWYAQNILSYMSIIYLQS